jgi:hypothetical protein
MSWLRRGLQSQGTNAATRTWCQRVNGAGRGKINLLLDRRPKLYQPPGLVDRTEGIPSLAQQERYQSGLPPDCLLSLTPHDVVIPRNDDPAALFSERCYPRNVIDIARKAVTQVNYFMASG